MPRYISQTDVINAYGSNRFALLADQNDDNLSDPASVAAAIAAAEAEVDSYVGHRYALPLPGIVSDSDPSLNTVPENIRFRCVDIAVYRLAKDHDQLTKERRKRYEDAKSWLTMLARHQVALGVDAPPPARHGDVVRYGPDRAYQLGDTDGLL